MTKKYFQLTQEQRYEIDALIRAGKNQSAIADLIGVHRSTICRELKRNMPQRGIGAGIYLANRAEDKTRIRHFKKNKHYLLTTALKQDLKALMIQRRFSPELVAAHWKKQGIKGVSHETIYRFKWTCKHSNKRIHAEYKDIYKYLRLGHRKRKRGNYKDSRGLIPNSVPIEKRPKIVEKRNRFGDLESDLVMDKCHASAPTGGN